MPFSARKMHFFDKKCNKYPCPTSFNFDIKKLFFPLVSFYLNSEGFFIASYSTWWNPPLNIFNLAKNGPFLEDLKKKVSKSYWNHIHKVCVTQIHYVTWFLTLFLLKMPQFLLKSVIFVSFKNPHFCLFPLTIVWGYHRFDRGWCPHARYRCPHALPRPKKPNMLRKSTVNPAYLKPTSLHHK